MATNGARPPDSQSNMEKVTVRVPRALFEQLEDAVENDEFPNRSEAVREGLRAVVGGGGRDG